MTASGVDLAEVVERDFVAAWWMLAEHAGAQLGEEDGLRWYLTGRPDPYCNAVVVTQLDGDGADATIDAMAARIRERSVPAQWWVMPSSQPADLADRLLARGFADDGAWPGMAVSVEDVVEPPSVPGLEIRRIDGRADFDAYVEIVGPILSSSESFTELLVRASLSIGFEEGVPEEHFLGLLDGRPVATTSLLTGGGAAGIYNVAVLEEARGRGIGAAITAAAIRHGAGHGLAVATLQASSMGRPVYERLGFRFVCDLVPYRWTP